VTSRLATTDLSGADHHRGPPGGNGAPPTSRESPRGSGGRGPGTREAAPVPL